MRWSKRLLRQPAMLAAAATRPTQGRGTFSTGADVSRFQRSSVPAKPIADIVRGAVPAGPDGAPSVGAFKIVPKGPVVRVARGNTVTEVEIGGKS